MKNPAIVLVKNIFAQKMYDFIEGLHVGEVEDTFGFIEAVGEY